MGLRVIDTRLLTRNPSFLRYAYDDGRGFIDAISIADDGGLLVLSELMTLERTLYLIS